MVIQLNPNSITAYLNRGSACANKGDLDRTISDWVKVIQLNPSDAAVYFNLGWAYSNNGQTANTMIDLNKVLALCGTNTQCARPHKRGYSS